MGYELVGFRQPSGNRTSRHFHSMICLSNTSACTARVHGWERLAWVCDVNELIRSRQDMDWDLLFAESKRLGCENVVALGLRLIREFFRFDMSPHDWNKIKGDDKLFDSMIAEIRGRLFSEQAETFDI